MKLHLLWGVLVVCLAGCEPSPPRSASPEGGPAAFAGSYPLRAAATVGMVADLVRNVGGGRVAVTQIMGSGVDPHLYKVTRDDVRTIAEADIVFYCGLMLEGKMTDTLVKVARAKPVIAVAERLDPAALLGSDDLPGHYDPHVWMDVSAWARCADAVTEALGEFDPPHADEYRQRAAAYRQQLETLHAYGLRALGSIPPENRVLVTSHDAFNYFGRAYGLEVLGVQGISTESEASLQRINELVDLLVAKRVRAVFIESSVPRKNMDALIEGARARGHALTIGGKLYSDAMGEPGTHEGTYLGMLDHNITLVARALGGEAPAAGCFGKLTHREAPQP